MAGPARATKTHADGTSCPEGTRKVPPGFRPCCELFAGHLDTCHADLRYEWWRRSNAWFVILPDGRSGIGIAFCPHCGRALPRARSRADRAKPASPTAGRGPRPKRGVARSSSKRA